MQEPELMEMKLRHMYSCTEFHFDSPIVESYYKSLQIAHLNHVLLCGNCALHIFQ